MAKAAQTVARGALLIAGLTILARIVGFGRTVVFANTVGQTCLGQTYQTTNTLPNIIFEIVAGGALASIVVPLIAGYVGRGDQQSASRMASALLTWAIVLLVPIAVLLALLARPLTELMLGAADCAGAVDAGATMLRIFAPQIVLYGVGIVLTGVLQAYRRFAGPAIAPLLSSLVVIGAYLAFAIVAGRGADLGTASDGEQLILSVGTTLGVVALSCSLLIPLRRTGVRLRPTFGFPDQTARKARALAGAGVVALIAQQANVAAALLLANRPGVPTGSINVYTYAQTVFLLPWAIAAVPIATAVFPRLSEAAANGDRASFARDLRTTNASVIALAGVLTAAMIAAAHEMAVVFVSRAPGVPSVDSLTAGIIGFAIGLIGYSLFALHSRALFAQHRNRANAAAAVLGWGTAIVLSLVLSGVLSPADRVAALSLAHSAGVITLGLVLVAITASAMQVNRWVALGQVLLALVTGVLVGWGVSLLPLPGWLDVDSGTGIMSAVVAGALRALLGVGAAAAVLLLVPGSGMRRLLRRAPATAPLGANQPDAAATETADLSRSSSTKEGGDDD